jgi:hypothetical protein
MKAKASRSRSLDSGETFRGDPDAAHAGDYQVARLEVAQPPAEGFGSTNDDHRVHALVLHFDEVAVDTHCGVVVAGGVEILRRAAVALDEPQHGVPGLGGRTTDRQQLRQHVIHLPACGRFHTQSEKRRLAVGAADTELLHFETAVGFDHLVEDLLHDVRIDQVAFGLDDFLKWHETTSLPGRTARLARLLHRKFEKHGKTE